MKQLTVALLVLLGATTSLAQRDPFADRQRPTFQRESGAAQPAPNAGAAPGRVQTGVRETADPRLDALDSAVPSAGGLIGSIGSADGSYRLGPRDSLEVEIWNRAEVEIASRSVSVTEKGAIYLPLVDNVDVAGMTVSEATDRLRALYDKFIIEPQVFIEIREYNSRQVSVVGEVKNPGRYSLKGNVKITEVIAQAGDLTKYASRMVRVIREGDDGTAREVIDIDLGEINSGNPEQNIRVEPNDTVYVLTNKNIIYLSGMVKSEGYVDWEDGMTAQTAVILAGGLAEGAAGGRAKLYRELSGKMTEQKIDLKDRRHQTAVLPGDIIHVPKSWF